MSRSESVDAFLQEVVEGRARLVVPNPETYRTSRAEYSPSKARVFYNPLMTDNRDLMVAVILALAKGCQHSVSFAESMGGVGVRTARALLEGNVHEGFYNDADPSAVKIATKNIERNRLGSRVSIECLEANVFQALHSRGPCRVTYLDLDPFGSPAPYLATAVAAVQHGGVLGVSATDGAVLNGVHPWKCLARYGAWAERTHLMRELGVRVLLGSLARVASSQGVGMVPLLSYSERYFARTYVRILRGTGQSRTSASQTGFIRYDKSSLSWCEEHFGHTPSRGSGTLVGPLWLASCFDREFGKTMQEFYRHMLSPRISRMLDMVLSELDVLGYMSIHSIAEKLRTSAVSTASVISKLKKSGYEATRTIYGTDCVKTNLPSAEHLDFFKEHFAF